MNRPHRVEATPPECALAAEMFDHFCSASTMKQILALHREICNTLNLKPNRLMDFYPKLKKKLDSSWKAQALFKKFDTRANHKVYIKGQACPHTKVLIIGAGPCGLRAAIECQLLGAKVVVIEKRDRISRNNVLHLWPFVIQDLKALGAKKFFGKFCAGSIDHISIRQLQCILLKVALLLGVEFHEGVSFEELLEPTVTDNNETLGWRARVLPADHPVSQYEFDTLMAADGRRNTLEGFKRKEFRGKLAMAITANFINRHSEQEASVPEISGVAFIFNQKFFKDLYKETEIDLENIVYYKDETHYFVMTAKKHSLLKKGVLKQDFSEVNRLLNVENVDREALMRYAQEAARFSTENRLPLNDFALNHYGGPDVALFDFTSMYAAENASMVCERVNRRLLCLLVGDSLLEPFWPTGSGCARGFLSALDASWAVRAWGQTPSPHPLCVIAERESVYRLLAQTTPENLHRDFGAYTLDPGTRYPNLNRGAVTPHRVTGFFDSDEPLRLDAINTSRKRHRETEIPDQVLMSWLGIEPGLGVYEAASPQCLAAVVRRYRPDLLSSDSPDKTVYQVLQEQLDIAPFGPVTSPREVPEAKLRSYLVRVYFAFKGEVPHVHHDSDVFGQIKKSQQTEKYGRNNTDHSISVYSNAADTEKSHSTKRKRRTPRPPPVSNDPTDYIRTKIGKLDLDDITQLARLIEGHDSLNNDDHSLDKQKTIQDEILALLDPEESPDPQLVRESIAQLLQGPSRVTLNKPGHSKVATMFSQNDVNEVKPVRPPRKLKGLDVSSMNYPDMSEEALDTDVTVTQEITKPQRKLKGLDFDSMKFLAEKKVVPKKKIFIKSKSIDVPLPPTNENVEDVDVKPRFSKSPEPKPKNRSNSIGSPKKTRRIAELFENNKRVHVTPEPRLTRSATMTAPLAMKMKRMTEVLEAKQKYPQSDRTKRTESIGNPELSMRRQKVAELIEGIRTNTQDQIRNASVLASRMSRVSDIVQKNKTEKKHRKEGRRKAAREITKQRYEKSLRLLAAEPQISSTSADLENDYGLQQYRANAQQFDERVKKLERKLQHYEEGRIVSGGGRNIAGGARVARLAAELASGNASSSMPKSSKPKDLMRSVGKIERNDWNVKFIEKKIMENKLGRPEPKTAERVPKWDREQFLGRQRRLQEGESEEKWGEFDETIHKIDQKLKDSGRPDHGTNKVANLATKFVKMDDEKDQDKVLEDAKDLKKTWRGPSTAGTQCAACGKRVFAAESVTADGLHLHRACFKCAVCKTILRPGNYTMERYGSRLVCLRHSGTSVPDAIEAVKTAAAEALKTRTRIIQPTPERIILEASDTGAREIDEDEWTDRNFLASETSCAGGLSDDDDSSTEEYSSVEESGVDEDDIPAITPEDNPRHSNVYFSTDSFGYDDSDDGGESSGNESCSRMREAREARRREVPADARPPTDSSEVPSEDETSSSSDSEVSSGTQVSTDSEFAREEQIPPPTPPAILVTAPPPAQPIQEYPLSRTKSAGGIACKRALELKRKYLLGEPSPPAVRKSESTSQLDTKFEAFRSNITEFQKLLQMSPQPPSRQMVAMQMATEKNPIPDIIKNIYDDAPVDLLPKDKEVNGTDSKEEDNNASQIDTDSLSDDLTRTEDMGSQSVPRVEVHDEGGELIQLDSLTIVSSLDEKEDNNTVFTSSIPTVVAVESESSESGKEATTLAFTETELSDWAAESLLDDCQLEDKEDNFRKKNPRTLSGPKTIHDAKNVSTLAAHVCGKASPPDAIVYWNALDHFEFADEGEQDPSLDTPIIPKKDSYTLVGLHGELVDEEYDPYSIANDRSMNFIERSFSEIKVKPDYDIDEAVTPTPTYPLEKSFSEIALKKDIHDDLLMPTGTIERSVCQQVDTVVESKINEKQETEIVTKEKIPSTSESTSDSKNIFDTELKTPKMLSMIGNNADKYNEVVGFNDPKTNSKVDVNRYEILTFEAKNENVTKPKSSSENTPSIGTPSSFEEDRQYNNQSSSKITSMSDISPPLYSSSLSKSASNHISLLPQKPLYSPSICRSASENFSRIKSSSPSKPSDLSLDLSSPSVTQDNKTPVGDLLDKLQVITREIEEQKEVVRRLVLERLGTGGLTRKSTRRVRASPLGNVPPPIPPPLLKLPTPPHTPTEEKKEIPPPRPFLPSSAAMKSPKVEDTPPPRPIPPTNLQPTLVKTPPSLSDTELARERRHNSIIKSLSNYLTRRRGLRNKWFSEPDLSQNESPPQPPSNLRQRCSHKSTGALETPPPVPPPPARYCPPSDKSTRRNMPSSSTRSEAENGNTSPPQWFEARWTRLLVQRRREDNFPNKNCKQEAKNQENGRPEETTSRRIARLEKALSRPLSAEQQAATVAELVQVSAQRVAHEALLAADRNRNSTSDCKKYAA